MKKINKDSVVLIAGGTGSIGTNLTKKFLDMGVRQVRVLARDETRQQQLADKLGNPENFLSIIGDIRDKSSLDEALNNVDLVVNAAAMKHVRYCDAFPSEALKTNVTGTDNLLSLCIQKRIKNFILISSDKAVDPTTTYGATKFLAERLVISSALRNPTYNFNIVRLGNVIGSRNSVLHRIAHQIDTGRPITVMSGRVSRYVMTADNVSDLVIKAAQFGTSGEIFIQDMPVVEIADLVRVFVDLYVKKLKLNPANIRIIDYPVGRGEKQHEALVSTVEKGHARHENSLIIISPTGILADAAPIRTYTSMNEPKLTTKEIRTLITPLLATTAS